MFSEAAGYISGRYLALKRRTSLRRADFPDRERNPWMIDVPPCRGGKGGCRAVPWEARAERRLSQTVTKPFGATYVVLYGISEKQISIANVNYPGQSAHHVIGLATFGATPPQRAFSYMPQVLLLAIQLFAQLYSKPHLYKEIHQMCISTGLCYTYEPPPLASHSCA